MGEVNSFFSSSSYAGQKAPLPFKSLKKPAWYRVRTLSNISNEDFLQEQLTVNIIISHIIPENFIEIPHTEAVVRRCSVKKVFLEISQKFTEKHLCQRIFLIKVVGLRIF